MLRFFLTVSAFVLAACTDLSGRELKLWYDEPASVWVEALPVGNGRMGAMIFGSPSREHLQLNEETIWSGGPWTGGHRDVSVAIDSIRTLVFNGQYRKAQELADREVYHKSSHGMAYQPLGDLYIDFPGHEDFSDYDRELDISRAISTTSYSVGNVRYVRETFASLADDAIIMHISASGKKNLDFTVSMTSPQRSEVTVEDGEIILCGVSGDMEGVEGKVRFTSRTRVVTEGGDFTCEGSSLRVSGADDAYIYI